MSGKCPEDTFWGAGNFYVLIGVWTIYVYSFVKNGRTLNL